MRLGFAHHWTRPYEASWSGTPWQLRQSLGERTTVVDLGVELSTARRQVLRGVGLRRTPSGWKSMWRQHRLTQRVVENKLDVSSGQNKADVVLEIQDLACLAQPYMVLQDLNYQLLIDRFGRDGVPHFRALSKRKVEALLARQERIYESAAMLLPMSQWLADSLRRSGVESSRIRVVNPGINVRPNRLQPIAQRRAGSSRSLLFVGRDFETKGGEQVVKSFCLLRKEYGQEISLTIAGPSKWPLAAAIPAGVNFLGPVSASMVGNLMDDHDLLVMPSLFEGFGIVFAEALTRGLPCIGRNSCAMPEIIDPSSGGRLVNSESPQDLAEVIVDALSDDLLFQECAREAESLRRHYSWGRAADDVIDAANTVVGR